MGNHYQSRWQGRTRRKDILAINHLERTSMAATSRRLSKAGTLAVLRGYKTCYAIKKTEVVVGRSTVRCIRKFYSQIASIQLPLLSLSR